MATGIIGTTPPGLVDPATLGESPLGASPLDRVAEEGKTGGVVGEHGESSRVNHPRRAHLKIVTGSGVQRRPGQSGPLSLFGDRPPRLKVAVARTDRTEIETLADLPDGKFKTEIQALERDTQDFARFLGTHCDDTGNDDQEEAFATFGQLAERLKALRDQIPTDDTEEACADFLAQTARELYLGVVHALKHFEKYDFHPDASFVELPENLVTLTSLVTDIYGMAYPQGFTEATPVFGLDAVIQVLREAHDVAVLPRILRQTYQKLKMTLLAVETRAEKIADPRDMVDFIDWVPTVMGLYTELAKGESLKQDPKLMAALLVSLWPRVYKVLEIWQRCIDSVLRFHDRGLVTPQMLFKVYDALIVMHGSLTLLRENEAFARVAARLREEGTLAMAQQIRRLAFSVREAYLPQLETATGQSILRRSWVVWVRESLPGLLH